MVSTLLGCASTLFSLTRDAAVYCAIMKPELVPGSAARKAGRSREKALSSIRSVRRSAMLASSDTAIASMSPAKASGSPWKLPVDMTSPSGHDHRVVDDRAELDVDDPPGMGEHVAHRAVHLRRAPQAVGVLDRVVALAVARDERAAGEQPPQVAGRGQLARVRADHLDALVVGPVGAEQGLDAHRTGDVGDLDQQADLVDRQREQHLHRLGAVDQRQALLRGEHDRLDPGLGEDLGARPAVAGRARRTAGGGPRRRAAAPGGPAGPGRRTHRPSPCPG